MVKKMLPSLSPSRHQRLKAIGDLLEIHPAEKIAGEIYVPGDKSISHRAVLLASLAEGDSRIENFLPSEDCLNTLQAMQALGASIDRIDATTYYIHGNQKKLRAACESLNCGNSGTSMRLLAGILASQPFTSRLIGDQSLSSRPMKRIMDPLHAMGAHITAEGEKGRPPLSIQGKELTGISYDLPVASAQVKSAILLAGLLAKGTTTVKEPTRCRDHTERLLSHFYAPCQIEQEKISIRGGTRLYGRDLIIPGDFSSAAFWIVACAANPQSELKIRDVGLNPTRTGLLGVLLRMGGHIRELLDSPAAEPSGTLYVGGRLLHGTTIQGAEIPTLIDELPILAVAAALAKGQTIISDAQELRVKETDRIAAMASNLRAFGVQVEEKEDGMIIEGGGPITAAEVPSYGDHRIAMACAILGLFAEKGITRITQAQCISTSYPTFLDDLTLVTRQPALTIKRFTPSSSWRKQQKT